MLTARTRSFIYFVFALVHAFTTSLASAGSSQPSMGSSAAWLQPSLAQLNQAHVLELTLEQPGAVDSINLSQSTTARLTVFERQNNTWQIAPSIADYLLSPGVNSIAVDIDYVEALRVQVVPLAKGGGGPPAVVAMVDGVPVAAQSRMLADSGSAKGGHGSVVNAWQSHSGKGRVGVSFLLPWSGDQIESAVLHYTLAGAADAASVVRQVNQELAQGGQIVALSDALLSVSEPVSPRWLKMGLNQIWFSASELLGELQVDAVSIELGLRNPEAHISGIASSLVETGAQLATLFNGSGADFVDLSSGPAQMHFPAGVPSAWQLNDSQFSNSAFIIGLKRPVAISAVSLVSDGVPASYVVDALVDGQWLDGVASVDGAQNDTGYAALAPVLPVVADALRLNIDAFGAAFPRLAEITVHGEQVGADFPVLLIDDLARGNRYGESLYLRGHVNVLNDSLLPARVSVANSTVQTTLNGGFEGWFPVADIHTRSERVVARLADGQSVWANVAISAHADNLLAYVTEEALLSAAVNDDTAAGSAATTADAEATASIADEAREVAAEIDASKGAVLSHQEASIVVEPGTLRAKRNISISALQERDLAALDAGMVNVTKGPRKGYRFLPHGAKFSKKAEIRLPFDRKKLPAGFTSADVNTYYFDDQSGRWVPLERESVDDSLNEVVSLTDHFTDMINAVVQTPDSPETTAFNPTSIKDLQVAHPGAGIDLIDAPVANNQGDARVSYPIRLPPGRQGMAPSLALQYSSESGNDWLGLGWSLAMPAISIDTRWGAPRFSPTKETETYTLNGEQLAPAEQPVAHRNVDVNRVTESYDFHPRREGQFARITRKGASTDTYRWEVTSKDGTRHFYGGKNSVDDTAVLRTSDGDISHWALVESVDTYGNRIEYQYDLVETDTGSVDDST